MTAAECKAARSLSAAELVRIERALQCLRELGALLGAERRKA